MAPRFPNWPIAGETHIAPFVRVGNREECGVATVSLGPLSRARTGKPSDRREEEGIMDKKWHETLLFLSSRPSSGNSLVWREEKNRR